VPVERRVGSDEWNAWLLCSAGAAGTSPPVRFQTFAAGYAADLLRSVAPAATGTPAATCTSGNRWRCVSLEHTGTHKYSSSDLLWLLENSNLHCYGRCSAFKPARCSADAAGACGSSCQHARSGRSHALLAQSGRWRWPEVTYRHQRCTAGSNGSMRVHAW
jgi:hypothetical protein